MELHVLVALELHIGMDTRAFPVQAGKFGIVLCAFVNALPANNGMELHA
jgi:hypothetical protein